MTQTNVASLTATQPHKSKLLEKFADRYSVDATKLMGTLKATCFKAKDRPATDEEMMALLIVADQYGLNPFTKEIFAFPDKQNGIVPVVGVDGWSRIINDHKSLDGIEFRYADETTTPEGGQECPKWCEVVIYRKDREHPTVVREYLDEVYRKPFKAGMKGPWQTHTKRFLRHKTLIQGARIAFGFSGIYDEDEAERIIDITPQGDGTPPPRPKLEDFEQKPTPAVEILPLLDEHGETVGEFSKYDFLDETIKRIYAFEDPNMLEAFWDHNADSRFELGARTEQSEAVAAAYNAARENLGAKPDPSPKPATQQADDDGWKEWCANFAQTIEQAATPDELNAILADNNAELTSLQTQHADWRQELLNRVNARVTELTQQEQGSKP